jgi:Zn finger protein HypA/HybF involved in hydrogenase expression
MHEYSLVEGIVQSVKDELEKQQLVPEDLEAIYMRVGVLALHSVESFIQAFQMQTLDTSLGKVPLKVEVTPGTFACECGHQQSLALGEIDPHDPVLECPQCGKIGRATGGMGLDTLELEISED